MANLTEDLKLLIRTRHALVTLQTMEEAYAARLIRQAAHEMGVGVLEWSISGGLSRTVPVGEEDIQGTKTLDGALRYCRSNQAIRVYILKDSLRHLQSLALERLLREVAQDFTRDNRTIFLIDAVGKLPESLQLLAVPFDLALPDEEEILSIVRATARDAKAFLDLQIDLTPEQLKSFLGNLRGLTRQEVAQVVVEAAFGRGGLGPEDIDRALEAKRRRLRQSGVLDYIAPPEVPPRVGGMGALRTWLERRSEAFTDEAREFGLELPKGILMLGVQGCGKSLMARFVAAQWHMPLLRLDVGALYNKYVGETERHLRQAFATASAVAPCVLWIDEIEKAFASAALGAGSAATDGGLSQRLFGQLLTWMQERAEPIFVVATANDVAALPPELLRKGRFDEVFFVDLPDAGARRQILAIQLQKRRRDLTAFDIDGLADEAAGFSGAELEQVVVAAMYAAFGESREVTSDDLRREIAATRPLSVLMAEKVAELRAWAAGRCVPAD